MDEDDIAAGFQSECSQATVFAIPRTKSLRIRDIPRLSIFVEFPAVILTPEPLRVTLQFVREATVSMRADVEKCSQFAVKVPDQYWRVENLASNKVSVPGQVVNCGNRMPGVF